MFWQDVYFGNSIKDWTVAFSVILIIFTVLKIA